MSISVVSKCFEYLFTNLAMAVCVSVDLQQSFVFFLVESIISIRLFFIIDLGRFGNLHDLFFITHVGKIWVKEWTI